MENVRNTRRKHVSQINFITEWFKSLPFSLSHSLLDWMPWSLRVYLICRVLPSVRLLSCAGCFERRQINVKNCNIWKGIQLKNFFCCLWRVFFSLSSVRLNQPRSQAHNLPHSSNLSFRRKAGARIKLLQDLLTFWYRRKTSHTLTTCGIAFLPKPRAACFAAVEFDLWIFNSCALEKLLFARRMLHREEAPARVYPYEIRFQQTFKTCCGSGSEKRTAEVA